MKERPILMTTESVRAILDGRKTQTRRVIKEHIPKDAQLISYQSGTAILEYGSGLMKGAILESNPEEGVFKCPYGQVGDRLWVRETFYTESGDIYYKADWSNVEPVNKVFDNGRWQSSIHMPRWASRITLEITEVRAERVQEITNNDAIAEGISCMNEIPAIAFGHYWDSLNTKRGLSWESRPWVWVIKFERMPE